jgi:hypothetical protein
MELRKDHTSPLASNTGLVYQFLWMIKFEHMQLSKTIKDILGSNSYLCSKTLEEHPFFFSNSSQKLAFVGYNSGALRRVTTKQI